MKYTIFHTITPKLLVLYALGCLITMVAYSAPLAPPTNPGPGLGNFNFDFSEKEIESLYNYLQNLDEKELEEIERLTKQTLTDMGYDPETLQPLPKTPPSQPTPTEVKPLAKQPEVKPEEKAPEPPQNILIQIPNLLNSLIDRLGTARLKVSLGPWLTDTNTLIRLLHSINKPEQHKRLALPEFDKLRHALEKLNRTLQFYEPLLASTLEQTITWEDPYEVFGLLSSATQEQIETAYERMKERYNPEALRDRLIQANWNPIEIDKAVREAQLSYDFLNDAYHKIKDPQSRAIVNRELQAVQTAQQATTQSAEQARQAIVASLSDAIYQDQVLNTIEQFIKKYEPQELALRKQMEQAQAERLKEHEAYIKAKPYGKTIHIKKETTRPEFKLPWEMPGFGAKPPSFKPSGAPSPTPLPSLGKEKPKGLPGPSGLGKKPAKEDKDKDKDKAKEEKEEKKPQEKSGIKPGKQKKEEKKKEDTFDALAQQFLDLDQKFFNFNENFDKSFFQNLQQNPITPDQAAPSLNRFNESTHVGDLAEKLKYVQQKLEKASERKQKQYKSLWKGIDKNTKEFKKNLEIAHKSLENYSSLAEKQPSQINLEVTDGATVKRVREYVKKAAEAMEKIEKVVGEKITKEQELLRGLAPR